MINIVDILGITENVRKATNHGENAHSYTMHSLINVCDDIRRYGTLDNYSAVSFENTLDAMKKLLRNGKLPLQQL